jgi:hypothetical protein
MAQAVESDRSEQLLLSVMPDFVFEKLEKCSNIDFLKFSKNTNSDFLNSTAYTAAYPEITVLFTDVVSFTSLTTKVSPQKLVNFD